MGWKGRQRESKWLKVSKRRQKEQKGIEREEANQKLG